MTDGKQIPRIEYSEPVKVKHLDFPFVEPFNPNNQEKIEAPEAPERLIANIDLTLIEKIKLGYTIIWQTIKTFKNFKDIKMSEQKDSKTTLGGIIKATIAGLAAILLFFGIELPADSANVIAGAILSIWALVELIQGYFSKDKDPAKE